MGLTLKEAKKYLKAYKRAYKMILKMWRWCVIPLENPKEERSYIEEQIASYTELVKRLKKTERSRRNQQMKLKKNKIKILGTEYTLIKDSAVTNPKLINTNAYVELMSKKIVYEESLQDLETLEKLDERNKKYIRHELVHAFFHESGLRNYCDDEKLVEWLALQFGKIRKVFDELGVNEE